MNSKKDRGDRAEREAAELLTEATGYEVRRQLGAGRLDDIGDLDGIPKCVVQVADWKDPGRACREKPRDAEMQRRNAKKKYAVSMIRWRGGTWTMVMTIEQFSRLLRDALDE